MDTNHTVWAPAQEVWGKTDKDEGDLTNGDKSCSIDFLWQVISSIVHSLEWKLIVSQNGVDFENVWMIECKFHLWQPGVDTLHYEQKITPRVFSPFHFSKRYINHVAADPNVMV